ncbi:ABC transporter, partial [Streptomyces sp. NPDC060027]
AAYRTATLTLTETTRDNESLTLQIPSDGSQRNLRTILDRLDTAGIEADELTVHTPDLDDVFFALTSNTTLPNQQPNQPNQQPNPPKETVR